MYGYVDLVVFVVFACRMFVKPALQATLRVFGLCGSFVVLVWVGLWFLVPCGFLALVCAFDRAHVVFVGRWSCLRCRCRRLRVLLLFVDC